MKKQTVRKTFYHNKKGFSLAELMMAVAIIGILAGVAFISVANYMRSMAFLERNGIAKEIFVAAQNHLTMADGQGFLGIKEYGTPVGAYTTAKGNKIQQSYFYAVNRNGDFSDNKMLGQLLPFGSIDETVRGGGKYIVHYALNPARVLNVFYFGEGDNVRYSYSGVISDESVLKELVGRFSQDSEVGRSYGDEKAVIGYFGEEGAESVPTVSVKAPVIEVINAERLLVKITDPNTEKVRIRLIVEQEKSGKKEIKLIKKNNGPDTDLSYQITQSESTNVAKDDSVSEPIVYVLDDITMANLHFSSLFDGFTAGEDITVYAEAEADDSTVFSNIATSSSFTVNSLYADDFSAGTGSSAGSQGGTTQTATNTEKTVYIDNIRHLENLDRDISGVKNGLFTKAVQLADMSWFEFAGAITGSEDAEKADIYVKGSSTHGYFYPVYPWENLSYEGSFLDDSVENAKRVYYKISDIRVDPKEGTYSVGGSNAGLFAKLDGENKAKIKDLELVDFIVGGSGGQHVGALAGEAANVEFENIVVYNTSDFDKTLSKKNVTAESGSAGGLIGKITGGKISKCAAALTVQGNNAGGLVGEASGCEITDSYSGGHTLKGQYAGKSSNTGDNTAESGENGNTDPPDSGDTNNGSGSGGNNGNGGTGESTYSSSSYNVIGTLAAGGFAGNVSNVKITGSYSTCSASATGGAAGGFIGSGGGTVSGCYATGLVNGANAGAFAGTGLSSAVNCWYYEIINEKAVPEGATNDTVTGYEYLKAGSNGTIPGVWPFDADPATLTPDADGNYPAGSSSVAVIAYDLFFQTFIPNFAGSSGSSRKAETYDSTLGSVYFGFTGNAGAAQSGETATNNQGSGETTTNNQGQAGTGSGERIYVQTHYGDWPEPEILVINEDNPGTGGVTGDQTGNITPSS